MGCQVIAGGEAVPPCWGPRSGLTSEKATPPEVLPKDKSFPAFTPYTLFDRVLAPVGGRDQEASLRREVEQRIKRLS